MNQPARTFVLAGLVVFFLLMLHQLPTLSVGGVQLRHVNILSQVVPEVDDALPDVIPAPKPLAPLLTKTASGRQVEFREQWSRGVQPIEDFSQGQPGGMDHFFACLDSIGKMERPVRIAWYGDSFIESDILTADLRELFQSRFGGNGVGWVDAASATANNRTSVTAKSNGLTEYEVVQKPFDERKTGPAERYYTAGEGSTMQFTAPRGRYPHARHWTVSRLLFSTSSSLRVATRTDGRPSRGRFYGAQPRIQMDEMRDSTSSVAYKLSAIGAGTRVYGVALESEHGVVLDNFSMRGSSGLTLQKLPLSMMRSYARLRPCDLVVLHFGLNMANDGNPTAVLQKYARDMQQVVRHFRDIYPEASILVVSISDREQRYAEGLRTMRLIPTLVALQRQLAADSHVAFLNLFQSMSGEGTMRRYVERGWANKDYTHLSHAGGRELAKHLFPSFTEGLKNYQRRRKLMSQIVNKNHKNTASQKKQFLCLPDNRLACTYNKTVFSAKRYFCGFCS